MLIEDIEYPINRDKRFRDNLVVLKHTPLRVLDYFHRPQGPNQVIDRFVVRAILNKTSYDDDGTLFKHFALQVIQNPNPKLPDVHEHYSYL